MAKEKKTIPLLVLSVSALLASVGNGKWTVRPEGNKSGKREFSPSKPVCFIEGQENIYYTTIEKALEVAGRNNGSDTVVVLPGSNPIISSDCTVSVNDRLIVPTEKSATEERNDEYKNKNDAQSGDKPGNYEKSYLKRLGSNNQNFADANDQSKKVSEVTINPGVTLTMNGILGIAGETGSNQQRPTGQTNGPYCQITLKSEKNNCATIVCNGKINCFGYIKNSGEDTGFVCVSGQNASIYAPFVIYNYRGGGDVSGCYSNNVGPFSDYDFPNIQSYLKIEKNASMIGAARLMTGTKQFNTTNIKLVSNSSVTGNDDKSILNLGNENSFVLLKYTPSIPGLTNYTISNSATAGKTDIILSGHVSIEAMSMEAAGVKVSTEKVFFGIPFRFDYRILQDSIVDVKTKLKFLTGSAVTINSGATVNVDKEVIFYSTFDNASDFQFYPIGENPALLTNSGILKLNSSFGGKINPGSGGVIYTSSSFLNGCSSKEWEKRGQTSNNFLNQVISESARGPFGDGEIYPFVKGSTYNGFQSFWSGNKGKKYSLTLKFGRVENPKKANFTVTVNGNEKHILNYDDDSPVLLDSGDKFIITQEADGQSTIDGLEFGKEYLVSDKSFSATITLEKDSCILPDSLILMADCSFTPACFIRPGDLILCVNHETGKIETATVLFNFTYEKTLCTIVSLEFEDEKVEISGKHGFFDTTLNKYVYLSKENVSKFVGHSFISFDGKEISAKKLTGYSIRQEITKLYCPVTIFHLDYFVGSLLSMPGGIDGCFNIFDYGKDLKFDREKRQADIKKYGLLSYKEVKEFIPYEIFSALPRKYRKVAIGKGRLTKDRLEYYRKHFYSLRKNRK